jgi:hypothetical protein
MIRIFDPPLDPYDLDVSGALHDLVGDIEESIYKNDISAATKTPDDPVARKIAEDFWKAVLKWFAEHPLIGSPDPITPVE